MKMNITYKNNRNKSILLLFMLFLTTLTKAQILPPTYPIPAQNIDKPLGGSLLTVEIGFASTCNNDTVTVRMPNGIVYIPGSILKISGSQLISEGDISNLRTPKFVISNVVGSGSIQFSLLRKANCIANASSKDTIFVKGSCGTEIENQAINVYSVFSPSLSITPTTPQIGAIIGSIFNRTVQINNGSFGKTNSVDFNVVYSLGRIENNKNDTLFVGGVAFLPYAVSGDTLKYTFKGATLFNGDSLFSNGESIIVQESIKVLACSPVTYYSVGWRSNNGEICETNWGSVNTSMAIGVPSLQQITFTTGTYVDRCTPFDLTFVQKNIGTGNDIAATMYNVQINHGNIYPGDPLIGVNTGIMNWSNGRINGNVVSTFNFSGGIATMNLANLYPTSGPDPDGVGGLSDVDGDGFYDDLKKGDTIRYTIRLSFVCNLACRTNKSEFTGGNLNYTDMCGLAKTSENSSFAFLVYEIDYNSKSSIPANLIGGTPFKIKLEVGAYSNTFYLDNSNTRYLYKLVLPAGFSVSGTGNPTFNGTAISYTQVLDTIFLQSPNNTYGYADIDLVYTCGTNGPKVLSFEFIKINNILTGCACQGKLECATLTTNTFCPGSCITGPINYIPVVKRNANSLGWTNSTMATRQVASAISAYDLSKVLYLDTFTISQSARQIDNASNLFLEFNLPRNISFNQNKLTPVNLNYTILRGGTSIKTGTVITFAANLFGTTQTTTWDLTSELPVGGLLANDSIVTNTTYFVSQNQGMLINDVQSGGTHFSYNLVAGVKTFCVDPVAEIYIVATNLIDGRNGFRSSACNAVSLGGDGSYIARRFGPSGTLFANEFRPVMFIDSVVILKPAGYELVSVYNTFGGGTMTANVIRGNEYVYKNPGTWNPLGLTITNTYGGNVGTVVRPTCKTAPIENHGIKIYIKDYYYALAGRASYPTTYQYLLQDGTQNISTQADFKYQGIVNNAALRPSLGIQNLTGTVVVTNPQHFWDIEINNTGLSPSVNTWASIEKTIGSGVVIDSVKNITTSSIVNPIMAGTNQWYQVSNVGLASGTTQTLRIFFKSTNCSKDSIKVSTGWNCGSYPNTDPFTDPNACNLASVFANVISLNSEIQLTVTRQPGNGASISLCTQDTVEVLLNSALEAYVKSPRVAIYPPAGVTLNTPFSLEYPLGSGIYQNVTSTVIPGGYSVDLSSHPSIGVNGIPGVNAFPATPQRQGKLRLTYNTDCGLVSGSSLLFRASGIKPCGAPAINNGIVSSTGINIIGATTNGALGLTISIPQSNLTCNQLTTATCTVNPVIANTESKDTIIYTIPNNVSYDGNFVKTSNCVGCTITQTAGIAGTTILKVHLDSNIAPGNLIQFSFDLRGKSGSGCDVIEIKAQAKRDIPALQCGATLCANSSVFVGKVDAAPIVLAVPDLEILNYYGDFVSGSPQFVYAYGGNIRNNSTTTSLPINNNVALETWFDANKDFTLDPINDSLVHTLILSDSISKNGGTWVLADTFQYANGLQPALDRPMISSIRSSNTCMCTSTFSQFVVGLPLHWLVAKAENIANNNVHVIWKKDKDKAGELYEVERMLSTEKAFKLIGTKESRNFVSGAVYSFNDMVLDINATKAFYRIKHYPINGSVNYSPIMEVKFKATAKNEVTLIPNPANSFVSIVSLSNSAFNYTILDANGKLIVNGKANSNSVSIDLNTFSNGMYIVQITDATGLLSIKKLFVSK